MVTAIVSVEENARCDVTTHSPLSREAENSDSSLTLTASGIPLRPTVSRMADSGTLFPPGRTY